MPVDTSPPDVLVPPRPAPPERGPNRLGATFLALVPALLALAGCLPWEHWCSFGTPDRCFSARLWGGSASLLGLAAEVFALALVVMFLARRGPRSGRATLPQLALYGAALAAIGAKIAITLSNQKETQYSPAVSSTAAIGTWIGLVLVIAGVLVILPALLRLGERRSRITVAAASIGLVVLLAVPYAWSGLAWWGGPLAAPDGLGGGNGALYMVKAGQPVTFGSLLDFSNDGKVTATMDGASLVDATPGLRVLGAYVQPETNAPCTSDAVQVPGLQHTGCAYPIAGFKVHPGERGHVLFRVVASGEGGYRGGWTRIRYHVGPVPFEIFRTDEQALCIPKPGKHGCPGDGW